MAVLALIIMWPSGRGPPSVSTGIKEPFRWFRGNSVLAARVGAGYFGGNPFAGKVPGVRRERKLANGSCLGRNHPRMV
jgi:hypothetical protein